MNETMNRDGLLALYQYNTYANNLVLDMIENLTEEEFSKESSPSHGSVQRLFLHMLDTEAFFLVQSNGQSLEREFAGVDTPASMRGFIKKLEQAQLTFIRSLNEGDLARSVEVRFCEPALVFQVSECLVQAMIHSVHHRGELSIVLTELGHPLPTLDIIIHFAKQSGQTWPEG